MKIFLIALVLLTFNSFASDEQGNYFTYDNSWCITYENENTNHFCTDNIHLLKIPENDCVIGKVAHDYNAKLDSDTFSRVVACFNPDSEENFVCTFDRNWKDVDGKPDKTTTECTKKIGKAIVTLKILRYPTGKYKFQQEMREAVESKKAI